MATSTNQTTKLRLWLLIILLLTIYLAWRIYSAKRKLNQNVQQAKTAAPEPTFQGMDSEFYHIEQHLQHTPQARRHNESILQWVKRLQLPSLNQLYKLHYQLRFDPIGLSIKQRQQLQQQAREWVANFQNSETKH